MCVTRQSAVSTKRPDQNGDGQKKKPSANPDGKPNQGPQPPQQDPQQPAGPGQAPSLVPPGAWPHNQVQERLNYRDLPPMAQAQVQEQEGLNPSAPLQMMQGQLQSSMQEQPGGPVPPAFVGPMTPPGLENFPHDMNKLMETMGRGYAPGANNAEHAMAQNAHAIARASEQKAQNDAAQAAHQQGAAALLGGLLQQLQMNGQIPGQDDERRRTLGSQSGNAPQLQSQF